MRRAILAITLLSTVFAADFYIPQRLDSFAFGSCNRDHLDQSIFNSVAKTNPDLFVWLGDTVYHDNRIIGWKFEDSPLDAMKARFAKQNASAPYRHMLNQIDAKGRARSVIGVWDDHDYGLNDAGAEYHNRAPSQQLFLAFIGDSNDSPRRTRQGVYGSWLFGPEGEQVMIILLDNRYFQQKSAGVLLGEEQWAWLRETLRTSPASVHFIGSGIQVLSADRPLGECWNNFPADRARLIREIEEVGVNAGGRRTVLLSGDVHFAEMTCARPPAADRALVEVTSSGLTHSWVPGGNILYPEYMAPLVQFVFSLMNIRYHLPQREPLESACSGSSESEAALCATKATQLASTSQFLGLNFGHVQINWKSPLITLAVHDQAGEVVLRQSLSVTEASGSPASSLLDARCTTLDPFWDKAGRWVTRARLVVAFGVPFLALLFALGVCSRKCRRRMLRFCCAGRANTAQAAAQRAAMPSPYLER